MSPKAHHRHSPSKLDSLTKCLRFKYKQTETQNDAANEGTELHKAFETGNLAGLNEEQKTVVQMTRDYVDSLKAADGGPTEWLDMPEQHLVLKDRTYGTTDRVLIHKTLPKAIVIDAKFGRREGEHAFQVETYGAAVVENAVDLCGHEITEVEVHVVSPRLRDFFVAKHDGQELLTSVRERIDTLYERLEDPFNPPTPHEDLCGLCDRADRCPALGKLVVDAAPKLGLPVPSAFAPDALVSDKDRAIAHVLAGAFENWAEQIKKNNTAFVNNGGTIPGFKLVTRSTGIRVPADMTSIALTTLLNNGISSDLLQESCTLVVGRLAKVMAEASGISEADAKETLRSMLADIAQEGQATFLQKTKRLSDEAQLKLIAES